MDRRGASSLWVVLVAWGASSVAARPARAEGPTDTTTVAPARAALGLRQVLERARSQSLAVRVAETSVQSARARQARAGRVLRDNPALDVGAGARLGAEGSKLELEAGIAQPLALAGLGAERDAASAGLRSAEAEHLRAGDEAAELAARTYFRAVHAQAQAAVSEELAKVDRELLAAIERRERAGEQSRADVALARVALTRAEAAAARADADAHAAITQLAVVLDLDVGRGLTLEGTLALPASAVPSDVDAAIEALPAIRALTAALAAADAEAEIADARAMPELSVGARYAREEDRDILLGTVGLTLPFFERGAVASEEARARATALRATIERTKRGLALHAESARARAERLSRALEPLTAAAAALAETELVLRRAYDRGERALADVLAVRRELTEARREALEHQLAIVEAELDRRAALGALR